VELTDRRSLETTESGLAQAVERLAAGVIAGRRSE
jgi:hypothetical protein